MADTMFSVQVSMPAVSGITADTNVNVWHVSGDAAGGSWIPSNVVVALAVFYDSFKTWRSRRTQWDASTVKVYRMSDAMPRAPIYSGLLGISNDAAGTSAPSELALCLSYAAAPVSGELARRKRGRIYLGPFGVNAINADATGNPAGALLGAIKTGAQALLDTSLSDATWTWVQVSNATGSPVVNTVVSGWIDNAWDIQRRRGVKASNRLLIPS
jgi:hypothetical protein